MFQTAHGLKLILSMMMYRIVYSFAMTFKTMVISFYEMSAFIVKRKHDTRINKLKGSS